jgi:hypothetical protein
MTEAPVEEAAHLIATRKQREREREKRKGPEFQYLLQEPTQGDLLPLNRPNFLNFPPPPNWGPSFHELGEHSRSKL